MEKDLDKEDYDSFREKGFEVVKAQNGKLYVRPYPPTEIDHASFLKAKAIAISCGFYFDSQGNVLYYEKK